LIGTAKSAPALAPLLLDAELSISARLALEAIPGAEAGEALRAAVEKTSGLIKAGIIDSLGERREAAALATIAKALGDADSPVVASAALALGKIGTREAAQALAAAQDKIPAAARPTFCDGYLLCADRLAAAGLTSDAVAIYERFAKAGGPRPVRQAAMQGLLATAGAQKEQMVLEWLSSPDADARAIASAHLSTLSGAALNSLVGKMSGLPPAMQSALLAVFAARGEKAALPAVLAAAKHERIEVRLAALAALGQLGDASVVPTLLATMFADDPASAVARRSIGRIKDPEVDGRILAALQDEREPARRAELVALLHARQAKAAVPVFLKEAAGPDPAVRARSIAALSRLAAPRDLPALIGLALKTEKGQERDSVEKAIVSVCQQIADADRRADAVFEAFRAAGDAEKVELLPLLGRVGGRPSLDAIRAAIASRNAETHEAGVRALCNWPDAAVADELLKLAQGAAADTHRLWALRAFVRVIALPSNTPPEAKLAMLKQAMQIATRDEERGLIIERAAAVRTVETLRFVAPYLDQPAVAEKACKTVVELAHHAELRESNKPDFGPALQKVVAHCKDRQLVDRARRYLQGI
jgi:HEAT repeat protein